MMHARLFIVNILVSLFGALHAVGPKKVGDGPKKTSVNSKLQGIIKEHGLVTSTITADQGEHLELTLKEIDLKAEASLLDEDGRPTPAAIKKLVTEYWPALGQITVRSIDGGAHTDIIYGIFSEKKPVFFFKISPQPEEKSAEAWENLVKIQKERIGRFTSGLKNNVEAPIITRVEKIFKYHDKLNNAHIIEVTHAAQGDCVDSLISGKIKKQPEELAKMGASVGKALGLLHKSFMDQSKNAANKWLTITHGDFHPGNIFIKYFPAKDKAKEFWRVYFIDNETMKLSLEKSQKIDSDVMYFIFFPMFSWGYLVDKDAPIWENMITFYSSFLKAYVSVFPEERQSDLSKYINTLLDQLLKPMLGAVAEVILDNASMKAIMLKLNGMGNMIISYFVATLYENSSSSKGLAKIKERLEQAQLKFKLPVSSAKIEPATSTKEKKSEPIEVEKPISTQENKSLPLHEAIMKKSIFELKKLLKTDVDVNARNESGETPLHLAVKTIMVSAVEELLKYKNIKLNIKDNKGNIASFYSESSKDGKENLDRERIRLALSGASSKRKETK